jgi:subtilisin family serine protease
MGGIMSKSSSDKSTYRNSVRGKPSGRNAREQEQLVVRGIRKLHPRLRAIALMSPAQLDMAAADIAANSSIFFARADAVPSRLSATDVFVHIFITLRRGARPPEQLKGCRTAPALAAEALIYGHMSIADLGQVVLDDLTKRDNGKTDQIVYIAPAEPISRPPKPLRPLAVAEQSTATPPKSRWIQIKSAADWPTTTKWKNELIKRAEDRNVMIGIIDVQGFDFAHPDFIDPTKGETRFVGIWDQGGNTRAPPRRFGLKTGSEITARHMNDAIKASARLGLPPAQLEPQSWMTPGSHGTHVASIAGGNSGVCPNSEIAAVLVSLEPDVLHDRRKSFYDSTRVADAVRYLVELAQERNLPIAINISLGTNGDAHDGSGPLCQWLDSVLAKPGVCICVAAGNAGQEKGLSPNDFGWISGRIHTSGRIPARGLRTDLEWIVVGQEGQFSVSDISENELTIWYSAQDRIDAEVIDPSGRATPVVKPRNYLIDWTADKAAAATRVSIYNDIYAPNNGANCISIFLSRPRQSNCGIKSGIWTVRLHGRDIRDGHFQGWIERDDPSAATGGGLTPLWSFPSFFSEKTNVDDSSISSLACAARVVAVGNLDEERNAVNITSSQGPTRIGGNKPEAVAPGTKVVAAHGFYQGLGNNPWTTKTGTSMASPYVAGVAGLMLKQNRRLNSAQIGAIIQRTSRPLPGRTYAWTNDGGFGAIDPGGCLVEAGQAGKRFLVAKSGGAP